SLEPPSRAARGWPLRGIGGLDGLTCVENLPKMPGNWNCVVLFPPSCHVSSPPRTVITGAGIITALGQGWKANAEGFRAGRVAVRSVSLFDVSRQRVKTAAEVNLPASL